MSRNLEEAKLSVISDINKIFKKNKYPMLPIDENPIQGDISIICFPGAQPLKKSPEEVAKNVSEMISHIKLIKETFVVKAFCNIVLDWDSLFEDIFSTAFTGNIIIVDTLNLIDKLPILGQEYIELKCSTPQTNPTKDSIIEKRFVLHSIVARESISSGAQSYSLDI